MNRIISMTGAAVVTVSVFLFAVCIIAGFSFGSYLVCMFLPIGYLMTAAGFQHESGEERRVAANTGLVLGAVYAVLILLVYFAQTTTVRLETLTEQAAGSWITAKAVCCSITICWGMASWRCPRFSSACPCGRRTGRTGG